LTHTNVDKLTQLRNLEKAEIWPISFGVIYDKNRSQVHTKVKQKNERKNKKKQNKNLRNYDIHRTTISPFGGMGIPQKSQES